MDEKSVTSPKQMRGFAVMNPELVRQIAESGGRAAHRSGRAHQFDTQRSQGGWQAPPGTGEAKATGGFAG